MEDDSGNSLRPLEVVSYLQARDPSILSWNRYGLASPRNLKRTQLKFSSCISLPEEVSCAEQETEKVDDTLNVYLRIKSIAKPLDGNLYKVDGNILISKIPEDSLAPRNQADRKKIKLNQILYRKFHFTDIFEADATQVDIFNYVVKRKVLSFINGRNSTLLAYGASGAGKTFTMVGTAEHPGVIPRSLDYLFRTISVGGRINDKPTVQPVQNNNIEWLSESYAQHCINNLEKILQNSHTVHETQIHIRTYKQMQQRLSSIPVGTVTIFPPIRDVWVSFAEIYNENIYDLLEAGRGNQRLKLQIGGLQEECYIKGLKHIYVRSGLEAYQVMQYGLHNLSYAATAVNSHSSRSHCIFSVRLIAGTDERNYKMSVFNFCDLAGSERVKKTLNAGDRLKESTKINSSLSVLSRCIQSIRDRQRGNRNIAAPFRESKLTQLFQKGLKGNEDIAMIVNINPSPDVFHESQHALIFSAIAKEITQEVEETMKSSGCDDRDEMEEFEMSQLLQKITDLEEELAQTYNEKAELVLRNSELEQQLERQMIEFEQKLNETCAYNENQQTIIDRQTELTERYKQMLQESKRECAKLKSKLKQESADEESSDGTDGASDASQGDDSFSNNNTTIVID